MDGSPFEDTQVVTENTAIHTLVALVTLFITTPPSLSRREPLMGVLLAVGTGPSYRFYVQSSAVASTQALCDFPVKQPIIKKMP